MNNKTVEDIRGLVRPVLTAVFGIAFIFGVFARLIEPIWLAYLTVGTFVFWFGDRAFKNLGFMFKGEYPVATPPDTAVSETTTATNAQPTSTQETKPIQPISPLDVAAFHEAVLRDVGPKYKEVNPCTIFYEARDKGAVTRVEHISQAIDYWNYLVGLVEEAFSHVWGYSVEEAIQHAGEAGCPTCPSCSSGVDLDSKARHAGMAYYAVLLDVRRTLKNRDDVYQLAHSGIDWEAKLAAQHRTLYHLGELAEEIMRSSK